MDLRPHAGARRHGALPRLLSDYAAGARWSRLDARENGVMETNRGDFERDEEGLPSSVEIHEYPEKRPGASFLPTSVQSERGLAKRKSDAAQGFLHPVPNFQN